MKLYWSLLKRDLVLGFRQKSQIYQPLVFQLLVVTLFPLALGSGAKTLALLAPAVIWIIALLSSLLTLDVIFKYDYDDGSMESYVLSSKPLLGFVYIKILSHWLISGLPVVLFSPIIAILLHLPMSSLSILILSLTLGTLLFSIIGSLGSALTMSLKHGGLLLTVLVMPLLAPALIFGAGAVVESTLGNSPNSHILLLSGLLVLAITLVPIATSAAIKINLE